MRKILCLLAIAAGVGLTAPASAHWQGNNIAAPGIAWAACSAPYGCASPLYTRRLVPPYARHVIAHSQLVARHHRAHAVRRHVRRVVHHRFRPLHAHAAYAMPRGFQYIDDPQLAAVLAWGDIVNPEALRR